MSEVRSLTSDLCSLNQWKGVRIMMRKRCIGIALMCVLLFAQVAFASEQETSEQEKTIPIYILNGLREYKDHGYEAGVRALLKGSPLENATDVASRMNFFKNIEMLYGNYLSHEIITVRQTPTSNMVYVKFIYEREAAFGNFTSLKMNNTWSLTKVDLHKLQKYVDVKEPR